MIEEHEGEWRAIVHAFSEGRQGLQSIRGESWLQSPLRKKLRQQVTVDFKMSLMIPSKDWAEECTMSRYSRCSGLRSVSSASSVMPRIPFMGVRISWLMLARNSLLARLAASAACLAFCNSASARFLEVMSIMVR